MMITKEEAGVHKQRSFHFKRMLEIPGRLAHSTIFEKSSDEDGFEEMPIPYGTPGPRPKPMELVGSGFDLSNGKGKSNVPQLSREAPLAVIPRERPHSEMDLMKERFAKLLLGEDMSGGGKGVSSALALSNAITNLSASVFGEQKKLEPMDANNKARWKREIDWLLSVTDHIVELVPSQQISKDGSTMEIMVTQQRKDLLMNIPALRKLDAMLIDCLDNFKEENNEFWYVSRDADESEQGCQRDDKWWLPTIKVCPEGLSDSTRKWLQYQKECVNQVLKASMAINAQIVSEMDIPEDYIDSLPKNGRSSLGESIYKNITIEFFDPGDFLLSMDLSTEHKVLDLKNRIEASIVIWRRKMNLKDAKSAWGSAVSLEKRELFEERAETILLLLKLRFPGLPQSALDISKIQFNKDVGHAVLESYSRVLESLAYTVMSRVEDVLYVDKLTKGPSAELEPKISNPMDKPHGIPSAAEDTNMVGTVETPNSTTLSDFMGWNVNQQDSVMKKNNSTGNLASVIPNRDDMLIKKLNETTGKKMSYMEKNNSTGNLASVIPNRDDMLIKRLDVTTGKKMSYMERIAALGGLISPTRL